MNYFKLTTTTQDVLDKIKEAEKQQRFSEHLDPIDYSNCEPVDETFCYIETGRKKIKQTLQNRLIVGPFSWFVNQFLLHTTIEGRQHLRGIPNAVLICNHVNKLDALVVRHALNGHRLKIMVGDFNNQKGKLGDYMRACGIMPFSMNRGAFNNFNKAVAYYLKHRTYILFFPERSEWWCYEKPRPYMDGAFHYAVKNGVPVIPFFITFTKTGKFDENGIEKRRFHLHILEPVYADASLSEHENMERLKEKSYAECQAQYEHFYHKKINE